MAKSNKLEITALLVVLILLVASIIHLSQFTNLDVPFVKESDGYYQENESMQTFVETTSMTEISDRSNIQTQSNNVITKSNPNNQVQPGAVVVYDDGQYYVVKEGTVLVDNKIVKASKEESSVLYLEN